MIWQDLHHAELNISTLYALLQMRSQIFVVEQACAYQDIDGLDLLGANRHILGWQEEKLVAYARLLTEDQAPNCVAIGRVMIAPAARGSGLGEMLMHQALTVCKRRWPECRQVISAQTHLLNFYQRLGFVAEGDAYDEDGISHIKMYLDSSEASLS